MITVIHSTNRPDSNSEFVSKQIAAMLSARTDEQVNVLSLISLPSELLAPESFSADTLPRELIAIQDEILIPTTRFIWVLPEYNGSFPGIVKLFIDTLSVRMMRETFWQKKSMLIGIATGRSGNVRGMEHFTSILHHLRSVVFPRLLPISRVGDLMDENGCIIHEPTLLTLEDHLTEFLAF